MTGRNEPMIDAGTRVQLINVDSSVPSNYVGIVNKPGTVVTSSSLRSVVKLDEPATVEGRDGKDMEIQSYVAENKDLERIS